MKTKHLILNIGLVTVIAGSWLGWEYLESHLSAGKRLTRNWINDHAGLQHEVRRLEAVLEQQQALLAQKRQVVHRLSLQHEEQTTNLGQKQRKLMAHLDLMETEKALLETKRDGFTIAGRRYTEAELRSSLRARLNTARTLSLEVERLQGSTERLSRLTEESERRLSEAETQLYGHREKLTELNQRVATHQTEEVLRKFTDPLKELQLGTESVESQFQELEIRLRAVESDNSLNSNDELISHQAPQAPLLEQVGEFLDAGR